METLLPLFGFAIATSITPGPNVLMVAAAAANHGVRATLPHMLGIAAGFAVMLVIVGLGLAGPFAAWPTLHAVLKWGGAAWLLVLAWKIARAGAPGEGPSRPPLGFLGAARALRSPAGGAVPVAAVVLGTTMAVTSSLLLGTVSAGVDSSAWSEVGGDVRVSGPPITRSRATSGSSISMNLSFWLSPFGTSVISALRMRSVFTMSPLEGLP